MAQFHLSSAFILSMIAIHIQFSTFVLGDEQFGCTGKNMCVVIPENCDNGNCDIGVTVEKKDDNSLTFTMVGKAIHGDHSYIAMGISLDNQMGDDAVVVCFPDKITTFKNPGGRTAAQKSIWSKGSPSNVKSLMNGDRITCSFSLPSEIEVDSGLKFDLNSNVQYLLLVQGKSNEDMTGILKHDSRSPLKFTAPNPTITTRTVIPAVLVIPTVSTTPRSPTSPAPSSSMISHPVSQIGLLFMISSMLAISGRMLGNV